MTSKLYQTICKRLDRIVNKSFPEGKLHNAFHHPAGPKTIFFWAPFWKWSIVFAGLADMLKPASGISMNNCAALIANGTVYTRWYGWAIVPRNVLGASCSFFTALTGLIQGYRRWDYDTNVKGTAADDKLVVPGQD